MKWRVDTLERKDVTHNSCLLHWQEVLYPYRHLGGLLWGLPLLSLQSCLTLCDPIPGILQARTLEWVVFSFSNAWNWKVKAKSLSHVWLFETPWTAAYQAPPSMGISRQEYWSEVPLPSPNQYKRIVNLNRKIRKGLRRGDFWVMIWMESEEHLKTRFPGKRNKNTFSWTLGS